MTPAGSVCVAGDAACRFRESAWMKPAEVFKYAISTCSGMFRAKVHLRTCVEGDLYHKPIYMFNERVDKRWMASSRFSASTENLHLAAAGVNPCRHSKLACGLHMLKTGVQLQGEKNSENVISLVINN